MAKNLEIALLFDFYGDMLTDKQRDVVELYYDNDLSLSEIAENEGITRQGAVSYTHLDGYKRQLQSLSLAPPRRINHSTRGTERTSSAIL